MVLIECATYEWDVSFTLEIVLREVILQTKYSEMMLLTCGHKAIVVRFDNLKYCITDNLACTVQMLELQAMILTGDQCCRIYKQRANED